MNDIVKFDPAKWIDDVKQKIKAEFVGMVPEDQWDKMVQTEIESFINQELKVLVKECLTEECKKRMTEFFCSDNWQGQWDGNGYNILSKSVKDMIRDNMPAIIEGLVGSSLQGIMNSLRSQQQQY